MGEYKTPGVYIKEKSAFGNSVVEAETAIPAFIGYTEKARNGNDELKGVPWKITSMTEFIQYFGGGPELTFEMDITKYDAKPNKDANNQITTRTGLGVKPEAGIFQYTVELDEEEKGSDGKSVLVKNGYAFGLNGSNNYTLYYNMLLFYANGGGACYVVSVGNYQEPLSKDPMAEALEKLKLEQEITMVVMPEAVKLKEEEFRYLQAQMLSHCGYTMKNRFALLDIYPKADENTRIDSQVKVFWEGIGSNFLSYGAAYFPWLNTSILADNNLNGDMFTYKKELLRYCNKMAGTDNAFPAIALSLMGTSQRVEQDGTIDLSIIAEGKAEVKYDELTDELAVDLGLTIETVAKENETPEYKVVGGIPKADADIDKSNFHLALNASSFIYKQSMKSLLKSLNLLPPSAAMAGLYTMVDSSRGVWKAPANVTLNYVDSPTEDIDDDQQADLNAPMNGKAINVIRTFRGEGVKVWGARTLDGNSLDWRYINVRRTLLFLEESVKNAARAYVFEPNDAGTWINMKSMIESFLRSVWKRGGLAGSTPEDAFEVHIGLGNTMTGEDILEGIVRITVLVAVSHPAEFIEITFQQQMQKS